jgi:methyltransferase family protein
MCGGAEWHTARVFHEQGRKIDITAVDINARRELLETFAHARAQFGQQLELVTGDSRAAELQRRLADRYDAVFIDGDHGYRGCRSDFELAKSRNAKLVGLHDIVDSDWHADARCCVSRLWRELAGEYRTEEKAKGDWGGIGVVRMD